MPSHASPNIVRTCAALCVLATLMTLGCAPKPQAARPGRINHPVFFKLNNPEDASALIAQCDRELSTIPGITAYYCGRPLDTGRSSVDLDFDVGLFVAFDSEDDYMNYVAHPLHRKLVEEWRDRLQWLRVHDIVDPTDPS